MPAAAERALRRRIKSVQSTKKITRAMELIAASRIVKAQHRVLAARPYSEKITEVMTNLARSGAATDHPLLTPGPQIHKVAFVVISADRGLAGPYNSSVIRAAERSLREEQALGRDYALVVLGNKAQSYFSFREYRIDSAFAGMSEQPTYENAQEVSAAALSAFENGTYDRVELVYTRFLSAGTQRVEVEHLMPCFYPGGALDPPPRQDGAPTPSAQYQNAEPEHSNLAPSYEFEPSPTEILNSLLIRYVESRLYTAMLDAAASEQAARQRAMKSATDNAQDLITTLTRSMNRARQDSITTEISEIAGGAEALRQSGSGGVDLLPDNLGNTDLLSDHLDKRIRSNK